MIYEQGPAPEGWEDYPHPPGSLRYRYDGDRIFVLGWPQFFPAETWYDSYTGGMSIIRRDAWLVPIIAEKSAVLGAYWGRRWWPPDAIHDFNGILAIRREKIDHRREQVEAEIERMKRSTDNWANRHRAEAGK